MKLPVFAFLFLVSTLLSASLFAESGETELTDDDSRLEIVIVTGVRLRDGLVLEASQVVQTGPDNSDLMRMFPGGNRNANGP